jgi:hypothetical protein
MTDVDCRHERVQCSITGMHSFPVDTEDDGLILLAPADLLHFSIVQVETVCLACGHQRLLADDEWELD